MNLEHACAPELLAWLETAVFASLSSTGGFSFSVRFIYTKSKVLVRHVFSFHSKQLLWTFWTSCT